MWLRVNGQPAADEVGSLLHAAETHAAVGFAYGTISYLRFDAPAIILDCQLQPGYSLGQLDHDEPRFRVTNDVLQGFLGYAVHALFHREGQAALDLVRKARLEFRASPAGGTLSQVAQRQGEAQILEGGRSKILKSSSRFGQSASGRLVGLVEHAAGSSRVYGPE
jgi:hypothetical protein